MKMLVINYAEKKFKRNDFNVLYDYLWRDLLISERKSQIGKTKAIRAAQAERKQTIENIIKYMEIIERDNLIFEDEKIYRQKEWKK